MNSEQKLIGERYELSDLLGRGGMAEVRQAVDTRLGRSVAVKQLRTDLATDPTFQARFRREAQSAAGLNHPTIVAVYDTGEEVDPRSGVSIPYIVMELVEGQTLREVLRDGRKILPERALELTQGVLDALSYSHKAGIVHRDIKPANVMLTTTGAVKVMDFGIARAVADTSATMTQTAAVIGTAQYLSPEQARGETVDARSDIYSAGCLLYELLVGRPPFVGESPVSVAYQHVRETPIPPSQLDPVITPDIDAITLKALAKSPDDRYQTAREMRNDIGRVLAGQQATAVVPRVPDEAATPTRVVPPVPVVTEPAGAPVAPDLAEDEERKSRPWAVALVVLLVIAALGGGGFLAWRALSPAPNPTPTLVTVPDVQTYTQAQAEQQLADRGLKAKVATTNGDVSTKGTVVKQDPQPNAQVQADTVVTITVNAGPKTGKIPDDLVGMSRSDAEKALDKAGFTNYSSEPTSEAEQVSDKKNEVLSVDPAAGSSAALDDKVVLTYATGESVVPDLRNSTETRAKSDADAAGFKTQTQTQESDQPAGIVIGQNPSAGSRLTRGQTITITVAVAKPTETPTPSPSSPPASPGGSPSPTPS